MTEATHITQMEGGTLFAGTDAINLFRAITIRSALKVYGACGMLPTRGVTATSMLRLATEYTGKQYGRGNRAKASAAVADMTLWIDAMRAAIPAYDKDGNPTP